MNMKTLGKLKISSEKMLRNEELVHLRGGYGGEECKDCVGQKLGDACCYEYSPGHPIYGTCHQGGVTLFCVQD